MNRTHDYAATRRNDPAHYKHLRVASQKLLAALLREHASVTPVIPMPPLGANHPRAAHGETP